jgi:hypothetical protein
MKILASDFIVPRAMLSMDNYANLSAAHPWVLVGGGGQFRSWMVVFQLGNNGATSITFKVQQAKDVLGTGVKDLTGQSFTHADPGTGHRLFTFRFKSDDLDVNNGYRVLRGRVEVTGGTSTYVSAVTYGFEPSTGAAWDNRISEVLS